MQKKVPKMNVIAASPEAAVVNLQNYSMNAKAGFVNILKATSGDYDNVTALLSSQHLPAEDIDKTLSHFFVAKEDGAIMAVIGLEVYGTAGLLRSMATYPAHRNKGIASMLVLELINYAKQKGIQEVFLLTETAETYFAKKGFIRIRRDEVPIAIKKSSEFSHLCPSSAILMKKEIV
jgi:amino-acid N-acetyltransferase